MFRQLSLLVLSMAHLAGCQAYPASAPDPSRSATGLIRVVPVMAGAPGYGLLEVVTPYDEASIEHLTVQLFKITDDQGDAIAETPVKDAAGADVSRDLLPDAEAAIGARFAQTVSFNNLKPGVTYRVRAFAYRLIDGVDTVISTSGEQAEEARRSYVDVPVGNDDAPSLRPLRVRLVDKAFDGRTGSQGITVTPGGLNAVANESID
jgi:hypothetical protein